MGTRAAFWKGDPRDLENRQWLGCIAFDGYPEVDGKCGPVMAALSEEGFLDAVESLSGERDFASPSRGWPFPWSDDVFLTDFTYAWFNGQVNIACFYKGFLAADLVIAGSEWPDEDDATTLRVPSGKEYDRSQPDSIMVFGIR